MTLRSGRLGGALLLILCALVMTSAQAPAKPSFSEFLDGVRAEALAAGISTATVDRALDGLTPEPVVVSRDRAQPEQVVTLETYVSRRVTPRFVAQAREHARPHREVLAKVAREYGVPAEIVTAIWGVESNFGRFTGTYSTVRSLATLAYDGRRPLFRTELLKALAIIDRGDATLDQLKGSWAGAMGQPQFMPSSFLQHAVDFDGDGRPNIWSSSADVFASMANYLSKSGWKAGERWGREVVVSRAALATIEGTLPMRTSGCRAERALTVPRPLSEWREFGVMLTSGNRVPDIAMPASLVRGTRRSFLVYENYGALLAYNCSNSYAISVGLLADRIGSGTR